MRIYDNGVYRDASAAEMSALETEQFGQVTLQPPAEERLGALETQVIAINNGALKTRVISLLAENWSGSQSPWSQIITINGVTENSRIDLAPTPNQLEHLCDYEISLMASNTNGVITIYALGEKPTFNITNLQVSISEMTDQ